MTSISAASTSSYLSPLQQLQKELAAELSSGTVSATDADALSSALEDINSALQSGRSSGASGSAPPTDMKSKIDDLIASEVSNGTLTSDQATELQNLFQTAFASGPGGAGGPPPGPPPSDSGSSDFLDQQRQQFVVEFRHQRRAEGISGTAAGTTVVVGEWFRRERLQRDLRVVSRRC